MPVEETGQATNPQGWRESTLQTGSSRGPVFPVWTTGLYLVVWAILMVLGGADQVRVDPTGSLQHPAWSAARMANRDLELAQAVEALPPGQLRFWAWVHGSRDEALATAIAIHQDVVHHLESMPQGDIGSMESLELARAQLAVLLAESGESDEALAVASAVAWPPDFADGLRHAYGDAPPPRDDPLEIFALAGLGEWSYWRVAGRLAAKAGESEDAQAIEIGLLETGRRWLRYSNRILGMNLVLGVLGVAALAVWALRAGHGRSASGPAGSPPWSLADGLGVLIRADVWSLLFYRLISHLWELWPGFASNIAGEILSTWGTLFASLPLVWLAYRHLYLPYRRAERDPFGLRPRWSAFGRLTLVAFVALGVGLFGSYAFGWASWGLGIYGHWAEGFDENLVWGLPRAALLTGVAYVVWAPVMEELAFRGVLFYSLRRRFGSSSAALLSATIFGLLHFYGLPGFLMTLWIGLIWALAFERTRSLWPAIAAHSTYNLLYVLDLVLIYR
jgi:membrane protease YdiL (CAAX protease family)